MGLLLALLWHLTLKSLELRVSPKIALAPHVLHATATITDDPKNLWVVLQVEDATGLVGRSVLEVDDALVYTRDYRLGPGHYVVTAVLVRDHASDVVASESVCFAGGEVSC
jgi:hypothetical protein